MGVAAALLAAAVFLPPATVWAACGGDPGPPHTSAMHGHTGAGGERAAGQQHDGPEEQPDGQEPTRGARAREHERGHGDGLTPGHGASPGLSRSGLESLQDDLLLLLAPPRPRTGLERLSSANNAPAPRSAPEATASRAPARLPARGGRTALARGTPAGTIPVLVLPGSARPPAVLGPVPFIPPVAGGVAPAPAASLPWTWIVALAAIDLCLLLLVLWRRRRADGNGA